MAQRDMPFAEAYISQAKKILELETKILELVDYVSTESLHLPEHVAAAITIQLQMLRMQIIQVAFRPTWNLDR